MDFDTNIQHLKLAYWTILMTAGPILIVALAVGL
ncbi:flagellar biosynthetic protein FliQ, partial [Winogradskyella sp. ZXX205]|nr:flagellar biosynthetic protein FliQ [Winogradskyella ouciana]